jgi:hypothetical protein
MKQKNNKVNSQTGALKQTMTTFQILNRITMKMMALVILLNLTLANLSYGQGDDSISGNYSYAEPVAHSSSHASCCAEERPVGPGSHKTNTVKVSLPSAQMVHRSDREVTMNLIRSLQVNRVEEMSEMMRLADQTMHTFFVSETSMGRTASELIRLADEDINETFSAEHINSSTVKALRLSDGDINDAFTAENAGLRHGYGSVADSDADINVRFALENTSISLPGTKDLVKADDEINNNMVHDARVKNDVANMSIFK